MNNVGREYAEALFELACEDNKKKEYGEALALIADAISENEEFFRFLISPNIPSDDRISAIEAAFAAYVPERVLSFVSLMCEKGRLFAFDDAVSVYSDLLTEALRVINVKVKSAVELSEDQKKKLKEKLEAKEKSTVNIEYAVDATLIGGVVVEMDDRIIDGSLQNRLQQVKEVIGR